MAPDAADFLENQFYKTRCTGNGGRQSQWNNKYTTFDEKATTVAKLMEHLFEIIDPYSLNKQGVDVGKKYRTGIYSTSARHLDEAKAFIEKREDRNKIVVEVLPLTNYARSAEEHQHHLERYPEDCSLCHIPDEVLNKYRDN